MSYTIRYRDQEISMPTSWNDLTYDQFIIISKLFGGIIQPGEDRIDEKEYYAAKVLIAKELIGMSFQDFLRVDNHQWADLLPITDFLDQEPDLNNQLIPSIRVGLKKFYGPSKGLRTSTFQEFITADTYFLNISRKKDPDFIYKLIATLYRPKQRDIPQKKRDETWNGDYRMNFNENTIEIRAERIKKYLPKKYCYAILYFYWGFRTTNILAFKNLFEDPSADSGTSERVGNDYGWAGTLLEMSGDKFGDFTTTGKELWFTIFVELSRQMDIQKRMKAQADKIKNK